MKHITYWLRRKAYIVGIIGGLVPMIAGGVGIKANMPSAVQPLPPTRASDIIFLLPSGEKSQLETFIGKPIILSFWASWCAPCLVELPLLDRLQNKLGQDIHVLPIALEREKKQPAQRVFERLSIRHLPLYFDYNNQAISIYRIRAVPVTFIIDRNGYVVGKIEGITTWDSEEMEDYLKEL